MKRLLTTAALAGATLVLSAMPASAIEPNPSPVGPGAMSTAPRGIIVVCKPGAKVSIAPLPSPYPNPDGTRSIAPLPSP